MKNLVALGKVWLYIFIAIFIFNDKSVIANNLQLRNGLINQSSIRFELSWDNSWNFLSTGGSYDAVWIFSKGKQQDGFWVHIGLSQTTVDHTTQSGELKIDAVEDGKGIFISRKNNGSGNNPFSLFELKTINNLAQFKEIRVFAIEMVYIPEGSFYLGDGASVSSFSNNQDQPFIISSEGQIQENELKIINPNQEFQPVSVPASIPADYPKGHNEFYCMKYEVSQKQYADFLNTLTYGQQLARTSITPSSPKGTYAIINPYQPDSTYRNAVIISENGVESNKPAIYGCNANKNELIDEENDGLNRAISFLSWGDLAAYLDWACLRPLTEFEFEKVCRGADQNPVQGEFAWGKSSITDADHPINDGTIFEGVSDVVLLGNGLANYGNTIANNGWGLRGPLRTGFAASSNSDRLTSGSSYFGVMEMSGNVWEIVVMAGDEGELFKKSNGDGVLGENGQSNQQYWCNPITAKGMIYRGGGWGSSISSVGSWRDLAISDRFYSHLKPSIRRNTSGGRGGR